MGEFHGHLSLRAAARPADGVTVLAEQAFRAPFHLSKPYWDADSRTLIAQVVNPTAGILAGDRLVSSVTADVGAALLLTTPSACRVFCMRSGAASSEQTFRVARGAWLEVLPEPLVPHRGSTFLQTTRLEVAPGGAAFYAELLYPGRIAHDELWGWDRLALGLEVRHGDALILRERFDYGGAELRELARFAGAGDCACFGNAVFVAPDLSPAPAWREALHALQRDGVWIGASALHTGAGWSIKFVAPDGIRLRRTLTGIRRELSAVASHLGCDARKL